MSVFNLKNDLFVYMLKGKYSLTEPMDLDSIKRRRRIKAVTGKLAAFCKRVLTKTWTFVVTIMLVAIGLQGTKIVVFRTVYVALFLVFILLLQV